MRTREADARARVARLKDALATTASALARRLGLAPRTARRWCAPGDSVRRPLPRGRPPAILRPTQRRDVLQALRSDPLQGVPQLRALLPGMPRNALAELCARWKYARRRRRVAHRLTWAHPGTAWAIDATQLDEPLDGCYPYLVVVRDLASRCVLAALPAVREHTSQTVALLVDLFERHGAPLVLKRDNGGPFVAHDVDKLLVARGVQPLNSPPYCPPYNGGVERTIGAIKRTLQAYAARPFAAQWSGEALGRTLYHLNDRRQASGRDTPAERWGARVPVHSFERARLAHVLADHTAALHPDSGSATSEDVQDRRRSRHRRAMRASLVDLQYLFIERV